jgi:mannose-6-phosphate isomerase-like protein (cupin superfamily)
MTWGIDMDVRRVVTGHDASGKAVFAGDDRVAPVTLDLLPGTEFHQLWGGDETASFPDDGSRPGGPRYFPPPDGFRFGFFTIPPDADGGLPPDLDIAAAFAEFNQKLPGMSDYLEPDEPGMHTTATIDYGVVLSGHATLELYDGATVVLDPGDTYIQNGTRHRWSNQGDVPAVLAIALIGARHANVT